MGLNFFRFILVPLPEQRRILCLDGDQATDQTAAEFDDTEIKCLLLGDENERQKAGDALAQEFGIRLMGKLRHFNWLSD